MTRWSNCAAVLTTVFVGMFSIYGCGSPVLKSNVETVVSWDARMPRPIPGIDHAAVLLDTFVRPNGEEVLLVLWTTFDLKSGVDLPYRAKSASSLYQKTGKFRVLDDQRKAIEFQTTFDVNGCAAIVLNGQEFDLSNGSVFLLMPADNKLVVKQLKRDMSGFPRDEAGLKRLVQTDIELRSFFESEMTVKQ